ncbi:ABC transporter ATP-binding protein [Leptospira selangorensis]|uniref:ABC transporter ATP-binding protein n=1 Tax=Leptospira selangorensis TaxID=2484982 RepID=A0A5F2C624_9LEPT|nr:ABC transporter ATP-binding protein [Leptospira selangorensis]TGM13884.1 ABC transporter ATP-binding protein [Leptospira selangorensis]TGM27183.1 ABC transporter ATP-binding protein [Leptospira selangorensis]
MASLQVSDLSKSYFGKVAISNLNFSIPKNRITGLLGPNGAGKTTALRILTGFVQPDKGSVSLDGVLLAKDPQRIKQRLGYLPESSAIYPDMTVGEYLDFIGNARGMETSFFKKRKKEVLELCDLKSQTFSLAGILSKGTRQRLALAGALLHDPDWIVLDEPSSGLDPIQISHFRDLLRNLGKDKIVLLSTHILSEVEETCDHALVLDKGNLVADLPVSEFKRSDSVLLIAKTNKETLGKVLEGKNIQILSSEKEGEYTKFRLESTSLKPEEIFEIIRKESFPILEYKISQKSLESVFQDLVSG